MLSNRCVWLVLMFACRLASSDDPCGFLDSVDLTGGVRMNDGSIKLDGVVYPPSEQFVYTVKNETQEASNDYYQDEVTTFNDLYPEEHVRGCACRMGRPCMRKCCPRGQVMMNKTCLDHGSAKLPKVYDKKTLLAEVDASKHFAWVYGYKEICLLTSKYVETEDTYLQTTGQLMTESGLLVNFLEYCLEFMPEDNGTDLTKPKAIICFPPEEAPNKLIFILLSAGMIISLPFMVATILVYGIIPELQNLHGKSLICYLLCLVPGFSTLAAVQIINSGAGRIDEGPCLIAGHVIYFFFVASFFWLNVMCFDLWRGFRGMQAKHGRRSTEKRRFLCYSWYAWGMASALTAILVLMHYHHLDLHPDYWPSMENSCWLPDNARAFYYFYGPMTLLIITNFFFFGSTAFNIWQIKKETKNVMKREDSSRHNQYKKEKQRFAVYLKLFMVMGVNWTAELLSFIIGGNKYTWLVTDLCNCLLGPIIFIIFVWKKKVKKLILKRYHQCRYGQNASRATASSRSANTSVTHTDTSQLDESMQLKPIN